MKIAILAFLALAVPLSSARAETASRTITMSGEGEVRAAPDMVTLSAGVTSQGPTAAAALADNSAHMQAVFTALKKLGISDKDMQTSNFSISPQMTGGTNNQPPRLTGYQVNNQVRVRLEDVARLGAVLDALVAAGANQMNGIDFALNDSTAILAEARADAVADARTKAETYARAAGMTLGPILSISETENQGPRPLYMAAPMMRTAKAVPVAAGEESVSASVSLVWEIH